jgi:Lamin Tail Domain
MRGWLSLVLLGSVGCSDALDQTHDAESVAEVQDALCGEVSGPTLTLTAQADTTLYLGRPNQNFGASPDLDVNRALIRFDGAQLSAALGAQDALLAARLELTMTRNALRRLPREVSAYRLTSDWTEGAATWNCPADTNLSNARPDCRAQWSMGVLPPNPWQSPASSTVTVPARETGVVSFDVTGDVSAFLRGGVANNGWMLRGSTPGEFAEFASRESATPPRLVLSVRRCSAAACDDGNACTSDSCDLNAQCVHAPAANGSVCDDGNACTQVDSCQAGSCSGSDPVVCGARDACHLPGTCAPSTGVCSNPQREVGASCSGANFCDAAGACVECLGPETCPGSDNACGVRTCNAGACGVVSAPQGTECGAEQACDGSGSCAEIPHLIINEVESNGGVPGDWVELYNAGAGAVDVGGWSFLDNDDNHTPYVLPTGSVIPAGGYYLLDEAAFGFGLGGADSARLFDQYGDLAASYSWTAHAPTTYGRCPNVEGEFRVNTGSTRGSANDCTVLVKVNEVESNGGVPGDWVELFNAGPIAADVSGWKFLDNDNLHTAYVVPAGSVIAAGGYLVLEEAGFGFGLGSADSSRVFDATGVVVDSYSWTTHATTTYGRCPNGTGAFRTTTSVTKGLANDCSAAIKLNEIESNGGVPGDWAELHNAGSVSVDVSGWQFRDNDDTHSYVLPAGSVIAASGYLVLDEAVFGFGLGAADSARLFDTQGALVDTYSWTAHASTTYGRCPNVSGPFATTLSASKGVANECVGTPPAAAPWPGSSTVSSADVTGTFGGNLSGLTYEPATATAPAALWAVRNSPSTLFRLVKSGSEWLPETSNGWSLGKTLRYPNGTGSPDSEGVTRAAYGSAGIYVATERNNDVSSVSRLSVLLFDAAAPGTELSAVLEWDLTADLPVVGPNLGLESITWVPDAFLVANAFYDESTSAQYNPASYLNHGDGLFFVGVEATGIIYAYALDHSMGGFHRVATLSVAGIGAMGLEFDRDVGYLWAYCDDTCSNQASVFTLDSTPGSATLGRFQLRRQFARPAGLANLNNEGIAIGPESECAGGLKPFFWSDDSQTDGHALRTGAISCGAFLP